MKMSNQDQLKMHSPNLVDANIEKIAALFPNCVTEAQDENGELKKAVDFDLLKQELSQILVEGEQERYRLDWVGKKEAILTANAPIAKTLRPCKEESVNFDKTENLFIEGDNLEALKLLQENYLGKVKMIYIDPPYNTGNDFVYEDDFAESTGAFFEKSSQIDAEGNKLVANTESNGRFHSDWLSMMYGRLKLCRNLLSDNGSIFISIDMNEVSNLEKIVKEIFGENNFIYTITNVNNPKGRSDDKFIATANEYLMIVAKNRSMLDLGGFEPDETIIKRYTKEDNKGKYREIDLRKTGDGDRREDRPQMFYYFVQDTTNDSLKVVSNNEISNYLDDKNFNVIKPIKDDGSDGRWRWGFSTAKEKLDKLIVRMMPSRGYLGVFEKDYLAERGKVTPTSVWTFKELNSERGSEAFINLGFKKEVFSRPKPLGLFERIFSITLTGSDIVVDLFSGSGSLGQALFNYNSEKKQKNKFILVQLDEKTKEDTTVYTEGYSKLSEVTIARLRKSISQLENTDTGFRVLKIDTTNMKDVYYTPDAYTQADILDLADHIKEDRTSEDLLFQVMLDWGLELSLPIERKTIAGKEVFYVAGNSLVACFDDLTFDVVDEVAKDHPLRFVSAEKAIHLDHDKTNIKERFKQLSPDTEVKFL